MAARSFRIAGQEPEPFAIPGVEPITLEEGRILLKRGESILLKGNGGAL